MSHAGSSACPFHPISLSLLLANQYYIEFDGENRERQRGSRQQSQKLYVQDSQKQLLPTPPPPTHLNLLNLGMGVEELLEFCWVDVLSSPNNHVLAAPYDFAVAVLVQARDVPAMTTPFWSCPSWVEEWLLLPPSQGGIRG